MTMTTKLHTNIKYRRFRHHTGGASYTPKQLAAFYGFPAGFDGTGQKLAVIELGGGFKQADLDAYFHSINLTVKPVVVHLVAGGKNTTGSDADGEVQLDLCVAGGMAPGVELHAYFAPNTEDGFLAAIKLAITDGMDAISISWGGPEDSWDSTVIANFNSVFQAAAAAGITVTSAAGDSGSSDGETGKHVDFPASSPYVLACGGTSLPSLSPSAEVVWNDGPGSATGGGVSALFSLPGWQAKAGVPGAKYRGVPDVAGCADPETGWLITVNGQQMVVGGTSAVAPMWAALACVLAQALGKPLGAPHASLYSLAGWSRDITSGNNGTYVAKSGYDCCTGQGVPVGSKLLTALKPTLPPVGPPTTIDVAPTLASAQKWASDGLAANWPKSKS